MLEDMDALAASVAHKHAESGEGSKPLMMVTASVDRIELKRPWPSLQHDLVLHGQPVFVGNSAMDVLVQMIADDHPILNAQFTMVGVDPNTGKGVTLNRLEATTEQEKKMFEEGLRRKEEKSLENKQSLRKTPPAPEESALIHHFFTDAVPQNAVHMKDTRLQSVLVMNPQQRNTAGKIFGGYLMRMGYELAWSTAFLFCRSRPVFVEMQRISFLAPVNIGNLVIANSEVTYSEAKGQILCVDVALDVVYPVDGSHQRTNTLSFIFGCPDLPIRGILPETYAEAMRFIEGRRNYMRHISHRRGLPAVVQRSWDLS
eukprot:NODE_810_length_1157_cov_152.651625_g655_i0.p2 GENE.NODE_810_length_1157_cov_152.651625_g655_i0~~NODE_810_length_1157_cov_152.651625_g655_i0.p2  ORF type:complete len:315 (-),score=79.78 NODE_810_length_1157_cov_152.651625_g655_i0:32-976(-)